MADAIWGSFFNKNNSWHIDVAEKWAQTPLFEGIPVKEIQSLARDMHRRIFRAGEAIFHINDLGSGAAMIISGCVEIRAADTVLATLGPGDFFGEVSLVLDERRTADAYALEDTQLAFFLRIDLDEWIARAPKYGARLSINLAHTLAKRLHHSNELLRAKGG